MISDRTHGVKRYVDPMLFNNQPEEAFDRIRQAEKGRTERSLSLRQREEV